MCIPFFPINRPTRCCHTHTHYIIKSTRNTSRSQYLEVLQLSFNTHCWHLYVPQSVGQIPQMRGSFADVLPIHTLYSIRTCTKSSHFRHLTPKPMRSFLQTHLSACKAKTRETFFPELYITRPTFRSICLLS